MGIKKIIQSIKPPCPKCPYKLGRVQFVTNPCSVCKDSGYQTYYMLTEGNCRFPEVKNKANYERNDSNE